MRSTEDYTTKAEQDYAYEVMWQYINPEVSLPYPEKRIVWMIPKGVKIWAHLTNCQHYCDELIKDLKEENLIV